MERVNKRKGIKIVLDNKNQKNLKNKKVHNPYGDLYRRRKSFFNFRDRSKETSSPDTVRRQVSEPAASSPEYEFESPRRQISEPNRPYQYDEDYNNNDNNNNPWELRRENDEAKPRPQGMRHFYLMVV